jgi:hypothetical protein
MAPLNIEAFSNVVPIALYPEDIVLVVYPTTLEVTESWAKSAELASKALATRSEVFFISSLIEGLSIRK